MSTSLKFVAPSAIALLSTALLCSLSSTALSQTGTGSVPQLPSVTVDAPKQVTRPQRQVERPQRPARVTSTARSANTGASGQTSAQTPSYAPGSVMGQIQKLEKQASSCNGGCETSFKKGNEPWVGCSQSGGYFSTFSPTCTDTLTYASYDDCWNKKTFLGWDRNRTWWYCTSLSAGKKFKVAAVRSR
jgi:hypothetical protein